MVNFKTRHESFYSISKFIHFYSVTMQVLWAHSQLNDFKNEFITRYHFVPLPSSFVLLPGSCLRSVITLDSFVTLVFFLCFPFSLSHPFPLSWPFRSYDSINPLTQGIHTSIRIYLGFKFWNETNYQFWNFFRLKCAIGQLTFPHFSPNRIITEIDWI